MSFKNLLLLAVCSLVFVGIVVRLMGLSLPEAQAGTTCEHRWEIGKWKTARVSWGDSMEKTNALYAAEVLCVNCLEIRAVIRR